MINKSGSAIVVKDKLRDDIAQEQNIAGNGSKIINSKQMLMSFVFTPIVDVSVDQFANL